MKYLKAFGMAVIVTAGLGAVMNAHAFDGGRYAKDAKIPLEQARQTALGQYPGGKITDEELEHEKGGSGLRYSFDVRAGAVSHEIGVDAVTGALLENSVEGPHKD
jgi:uncharacterized membrane protein YkoI